MIKWKEYSIGELCEVGRGSSPRPIVDQRYFVNGNIPWIKIADATSSGKYIYKTKEYVNEYGASFSRILEPNSLIIAASGTLGQINFLGVRGCIHDGWLYISNYKNELIDKEYLYHFFKTIGKELENLSYGAAIQNINTTILKNIKMVLPPLSTQQRIASILSAYDDLIEVNNRRIKLLEETARELYKEWFVRMRFPGYKQVKFVKGVPEGWEVKPINDLVTFLSGYSFKSSHYSAQGEFGIVTIKNVQDGYFIKECTDHIDNLPSNLKKHCVLQTGDTLMSLTGNVGRVCHVVGDNLLLNQRVAKLKPKIPNSAHFIYCLFREKSMIQFMENISLGSTAQMNLSPVQLGKQKTIIPDNTVLSKFERICAPIFQNKNTLVLINESLRQIRDRLLPRLISGKLEVS